MKVTLILELGRYKSELVQTEITLLEFPRVTAQLADTALGNVIHEIEMVEAGVYELPPKNNPQQRRVHETE